MASNGKIALKFKKLSALSGKIKLPALRSFNAGSLKIDAQNVKIGFFQCKFFLVF